jgi:putative transposase
LRRRLETGVARILSATISREADRWFCSFTTEVERDDSLPAKPGAVVGVDVGVRYLAVLSTGARIPNPRALRIAQRKLRRLQRRADRQRRHNNPDCYDERGRAISGRQPARRSNRMRHTERRIARLHGHARNIRRDAIHKLTTSLAATYGTIGVERLYVAGLVRNRALASSLHDASLAEIRRQLTYKTAWRGSRLIEAPAFFASSKTCSGCGGAKAKLSLSERIYRCHACGLVLDRDENAARNLAALASVVAASGAETKNARSPTQVRPDLTGLRVDREAGVAPVANETGAAFEQSEAA